MRIFELDPSTDPRWPALLAQRPEAGIFHTQGWLQALRSTYGYQPVAFTTSDGPTLTHAAVFCENRSPLTGRRLVSLPFSDHCQALADGPELATILQQLAAMQRKRRWRYIELRPATPCSAEAFHRTESFQLHRIDLRPELPVIQKRFHDSCIRRKIKRAEKEDLLYEAGRSPELLEKFRFLLLLTRRRHKLPPQPAAWFRNVIHFLGEEATIHVVSKNGAPVASIMTLRFKNVLTYKYGCSDSTVSNLGGTPLLFWKVIQQARQDGVEEFDLGRSAADDPGLIAFKEHLGAHASELVYTRSPAPSAQGSSMPAAAGWLRTALTHLPDPLFAGVGTLVYRHIG